MDVTKIADGLAARISAQLRVRGTGLAEVSAKAGRKLPKHLHVEVDVVVEAMQMVENPKLARLVDVKRVANADRKVRRFLNKQNPSAERRGEILDRIAAIAFVLVLIALVVFFVLISRGYFETP